MGRNNEIHIKSRVDNSQLDRDFKQTRKVIQKNAKAMESATKQAAGGFKQMDRNAGLAGATLMSVGGVISDAQFGMRGIANNLQQLGMLFPMLMDRTNGFKGAMQSLLGVMRGPAGLAIAFTSVISLISVYSAKQAQARREKERAAKAAKAQAKALAEEGRVRALYNKELKETEATLKEINHLNAAQLRQKIAEAQSSLALESKLLKDALLDQRGAWELMLQKGGKARDWYMQATNVLLELQQNIAAQNQVIAEAQKALDALTKKKKDDTAATKENIKATKDWGLEVKKVMKELRGAQGGMEAPAPALMDTSQADSMFAPFTGKSFTEFSDKVAQMQSMTAELNASFRRFAADGIMSVAEGLVAAFDGGEKGFQTFTSKLLGAMGTFLQAIGSAVIAYGTAADAFKAAFASLSPGVAIAAGIAAITAGAAVKSLAAKGLPELAEGGLAFAPTLAMVGDNKNANIDPEVIAPLSKLQKMMGGGTTFVEGTIKGEDIHLSNRRYTRRLGRTR